MLALTHASFFGVVLPHLLLLGQEGLGACKGAEAAALDSGADSLKHTESEQLYGRKGKTRVNRGRSRSSKSSRDCTVGSSSAVLGRNRKEQ